jgi:guanosine-3',5'-bis(diphosphate) 3'-pyrophosphohydrolase
MTYDIQVSYNLRLEGGFFTRSPCSALKAPCPGGPQTARTASEGKKEQMNYTEQEMSSVLTALNLSAEKHRNQRRKDAESTPYINHPIEVADLLWRVGKVRDIRVIVAALLHDIIEDTRTEPGEISALFGDAVLSLVLEVTDDKRLPKLERKRLQVEHAARLSESAKQIKLADKICNVRDVTGSPPKDWDIARRKDYLGWTEKVIEGVRGSNPALEVLYDRVLGEGRNKLK